MGFAVVEVLYESCTACIESVVLLRVTVHCIIMKTPPTMVSNCKYILILPCNLLIILVFFFPLVGGFTVRVGVRRAAAALPGLGLIGVLRAAARAVIHAVAVAVCTQATHSCTRPS